MGTRHHVDEIRDAIAHSIGTATEAILILLLIGALSGTWLLAGIIPAFIHYGMMICKPGIFLLRRASCAPFSLRDGQFMGTVGTVGIALVGISSPRLGGGWVAGRSSAAPTLGTKCRR